MLSQVKDEVEKHHRYQSEILYLTLTSIDQEGLDRVTELANYARQVRPCMTVQKERIYHNKIYYIINNY